MAILSIKVSDVETARDRVRSLMERNLKRIGKRTGWHQYIGEEKVGDVATGQGILIMNYLDYCYPFLSDLFTTLRQGQLYRAEDGLDTGGWALLSSKETPTVEATVWAVLGLLAGGESAQTQSLQDGKAWLIRHQNEDGGWGPRKAFPSRTYTTFLACRCLDALENHGVKEQFAYYGNAIKWLLANQNEDGGWGESIGEKSSVVHTAYALIALNHLGMASASNQIRKGVRFLYAQWNEKNMWDGALITERYEIPSAQQNDRTWARVSIEYFPTPWAVIALLAVGESAGDERIFSSVKWLLRKQNRDGSWTLTNVQRNRLWAVHDGLLAINTFMSKIMTSQTTDRMFRLENTLLISSSTHRSALVRQVFIGSFSLLTIGVFLGLGLSAFIGLNNPIKTWIEHYWAWLILVVYILSAIPLVRLRVITWKDAFLGIVVPVILVILAFFLPH